jgi:hypothetical protein
VFYRHIGQLMKIEGIPETLDDMREWVDVRTSVASPHGARTR